MKTAIRPALTLLVLLSAITGVVYPVGGDRHRPGVLSPSRPPAA